MSNHALLVDLSHLIYRSVCIPTLAKMHTKKEKIPTGGIYGVLQSIYKCLEMDPTINKVYLLKMDMLSGDVIYILIIKQIEIVILNHLIINLILNLIILGGLKKIH